MKYFIVDAFTSQPFGGNPAGVVFVGESEFPDDTLMRRIAAELRYSETAFVQHNGEREFTIRYFTSTDEVPLCGHATIATFGVLCQKRIVQSNETCINHSKAGDLQIRTGDTIMMQMAQPQALATLEDSSLLDKLYGIMGGNRDGVTLLPRIVSTGLPDIMLPVRDTEALQALQPDMKALSELSENMDVTGVHAFALSNDNYTAHVRNFGPRYGINEESATGTANAALTYYLYLNGMIEKGTACRFLQGEAMQRPSVIATKLDVRSDNCDIWVGGESCIVAQGELSI